MKAPLSKLNLKQTNITMQIANPIYDIIFKYLMENDEIAKDILSALLNEKIIQVALKPQETITETRMGVRIFRLDFKATLQKADGSLSTVLIEIQKAKKTFVIQRFRRYLGANYLLEELIVDTQRKGSLPITTIYFLGYKLKNIKLPVLKVERSYMNAVTRRKIKNPIKEDFVEHLSHDMYVIQIPKLKKMVAQTELEKMLDVFSQNKYKTNDSHVLEYTGDMSDPRIARIIKYLNRAMSDDEIIRAMVAEDEVEGMFFQLEEDLERERQAKEEERQAKEQALQAKEQALQENEILRKQIEILLKKEKND